VSSAPLRIGLVGDRSDDVRAHAAIPPALAGAGRLAGRPVEPVWLPTDDLPGDDVLLALDGIWCTPGSPYLDTEAALHAIGLARRHGRPFLGTCGGFQHALLEWARNVAGIADAEHAESSPDAPTHVIAPLACSLVGQEGAIRLEPGSRAAGLVGATASVERYHCSYGLAPEYVATLLGGPLHATGWDDEGGVRVVELDGHPFFLATLFQPELSSTAASPHGVVAGFMAACAGVRAPFEVPA
jgi:CTP synthase (UTP-ammonia lyase)